MGTSNLTMCALTPTERFALLIGTLRNLVVAKRSAWNWPILWMISAATCLDALDGGDSNNLFVLERDYSSLTGLSTRIGYHTEAHGIPEKYYEQPGSTW